LLADRLRLENSLLYAGLNRDTSSTQLSAALVRRFACGMLIQVDYLSRSLRLASMAGTNETVERRARLEIRFTSGNTSVRSYIAHNAKRNHDDYVSLFVNVKLTTRKLGSMEVWSNLSRLTGRRIDYWYVFVRNEQHLSDRVHMITKLGNAFQRGSADESRLILSMEFVASL
jgi:hypothetical protein